MCKFQIPVGENSIYKFQFINSKFQWEILREKFQLKNSKFQWGKIQCTNSKFQWEIAISKFQIPVEKFQIPVFNF